ncbi:hypothetical protein F4780DRAFT_789907 [Xylariomycetidae sp. FL0641]|nr:hypothetical protein F4780DRAFT_789907 [Xylariomycetidae sp. FL0641]
MSNNGNTTSPRDTTAPSPNRVQYLPATSSAARGRQHGTPTPRPSRGVPAGQPAPGPGRAVPPARRGGPAGSGPVPRQTPSESASFGQDRGEARGRGRGGWGSQGQDSRNRGSRGRSSSRGRNGPSGHRGRGNQRGGGEPRRGPQAPGPSTTITNPNYRGDAANPRNQSAEVPAGQNCSVFIGVLPPDCSYNDLLSNIKDCGKVYACHISGPADPVPTAAAKVTFCDREAVNRLLIQQSQGRFWVRGLAPHVRINRVSVAPHDTVATRVLHITGPQSLLHPDVLKPVFENMAQFDYDIEGSSMRPGTEGGRPCLELRFSSIRVQSTNAKRAIERQKERTDLPEDEMLLWKDVTVEYGRDPCDRS